MTARLADALRKQRHLRGERVLWRADGHPKVTQVLLNKWMSRIQRLAGLMVTGGIHILRHTFCSRLAMAGAPAKAIQELAGHQNLSTTPAVHAPEPGGQVGGHPDAGGVEAEGPKWRRAGDREDLQPVTE